MNRHFALLLLLFGLRASAQQWCAPGAQWLYSFYSQEATGVKHAWYSGDTIVGGLPAKRIDQTIYAYQPIPPFGQAYVLQDVPLFTAEVDDRVMLWDAASSSYDTLMWFGAVPGQRWNVPEYLGPSAYFEVLDTGTSVIDGVTLRYLVIEEPIVMGFVDTLRERIGFNTWYLRPIETIEIDITTGALQCYGDVDIAQFLGPIQLHPCDFALSIEEERTTGVGPYPNPGTDHFALPLSLGAHRITLFDALGQLVLEQRTSGAQAIIATGELPSGIYTVRIDAERTPLRWVKQ